MAALKLTEFAHVMLLSVFVGTNAQYFEAMQSGSVTGTMLSIISSVAGGQDGTQYYLQTDGGNMYGLVFCADVTLGGIAPSTRVTVSYSHIADGVVYSCQTPQQLGQSRRVLFGGTIDAPTRPTFLVYITTMCGYNQPAPATPQMVTDLFTGKGDSLGRTLAGYYNTCSYGQVKILPSQVKVLGPVEIPCSGQVDLPFSFPSGNNFTTTDCNNDNLLKWQFYLDSVAAKQGVTATDYNHKVMLLPKGLTDGFPGCYGSAGISSIGPWVPQSSPANNWGTGLIWIAGEYFPDIDILFHEIGHNLGMAHASVPGGCDLVDQCDHTCPMGSGDNGTRCPNAPHLWQLGWGQPFQQFTDTDLSYGVPRVINTPQQLRSPNSFVLVDLNSTTSPNLQLFLSARTDIYPYDLPYNNTKNGKAFVAVHSYSGTQSVQYKATVLLAELAPNEAFTHKSSGLIFKFLGWNTTAGEAQVAVCRHRGCGVIVDRKGYDVDCDSLVDDPDVYCRRPPPPPRSPRKPR